METFDVETAKGKFKKKSLQDRVFIRLNNEQKAELEKKVHEAGYPSKSQYLRKLITDGYVVKIDTKPIREYLYLIRNAASSINQIAKKANTTDSVVIDDVLTLKESMSALKDVSISVADCMYSIISNASDKLPAVPMKNSDNCCRLKIEVKSLLESLSMLKSEAERLEQLLQTS